RNRLLSKPLRTGRPLVPVSTVRYTWWCRAHAALVGELGPERIPLVVGELVRTDRAAVDAVGGDTDVQRIDCAAARRDQLSGVWISPARRPAARDSAQAPRGRGGGGASVTLRTPRLARRRPAHSRAVPRP